MNGNPKYYHHPKMTQILSLAYKERVRILRKERFNGLSCCMGQKVLEMNSETYAGEGKANDLITTTLDMTEYAQAFGSLLYKINGTDYAVAVDNLHKSK